ncbi:uncharacterized protein LOC115963485 isoform X3 [Quercus lobata]|uniref:uncharacterized protein LOC115963485 isoform X3 n=1 Tax=Quercus lobata TaxID=97700 RepID=UPI001244563D|nr:uncharacterized protein LOC115963485 isoform X3 [Quercus lobata]
MAVAMVVCRCRSVLRNVDFRGWDPNPKPKPPIWALESQNSLISNNGMRRAAEFQGFIILGKSSSNIGKVWILGFINLGKSSSNIGKGHVGLSVASEDNDLKKMVAEKIMPQLGLLLFELY